MRYLLTLLFAVGLQGQVLIDHYRTGSATDGNGLLTGLQAYWEFEEASGNALDSSGNGRDLTFAGDVGDLPSDTGAILQGRYHNSGDDNDAFYVADAAWQEITGDFTIVLFYRPSVAAIGSVQDQAFIVKGGPGNVSYMLLMDRGAYANEYAFAFYYGSGGFENELMHVEMAGTHGVEEFFIYIKRSGDDFELGYATVDEASITHTATVNAVINFADNISALSVGNWLSGTTPETGWDVEGVIDQVGFWNVALSSCQLNKIRNKKPFSEWDTDACN